MKSKCVCCGHYTINNENPLYHDIYPVCFWENDPIQNEKPDYVGGANKMSLNEAKKSYELYGAISQEFIQYVRKPFNDEI